MQILRQSDNSAICNDLTTGVVSNDSVFSLIQCSYDALYSRAHKVTQFSFFMFIGKKEFLERINKE